MTSSKSQCEAHTRTPWGRSPHRYSTRARYSCIGLLVVLFLGLIITACVFATKSILQEETTVREEQQDKQQMHTGTENDDSFSHKRALSSSLRPTPSPSSFTLADDPMTPRDEFALYQAGIEENSTDTYFPLFNECGDQFNGCERYYKPNFCCPFGNTCYASTISPSGIFCCKHLDSCLVSTLHVPSCISGTVACPLSTGGGCCPLGSTCSPDGCLRVQLGDEHPKYQYPDNSDPFSRLPGQDASLTLTVTMPAGLEAGTSVSQSAPQATYTVVKIGEMADVNGAPPAREVHPALRALFAAALVVLWMEHHCS